MAGNALRVVFLFLAQTSFLFAALSTNQLCDLFFEHIERSPYFSLAYDGESFADELFLLGEHKLASLEYEREFAITNDEEKRFRMGLSYVKEGEIEKGKRCFEQLLLTDSPDIRFRAQQLLGFLHIKAGDLPASRFEFADLRAREENPLSKLELSYWLGWTYLLEFDFKRAEKEFSKVAEEKSFENKFFQSAYIIEREIKNRINEFDHRSPVLARWLSAVVPGAGQVYVGEYRDGAISFILNSIFGYITFSSLLSGKYFQSIVYFYLFFARYYFGSGDNAYRLAIELNEKEKASFVGELIKAHLIWQNE